jgi:hypothetical protein
MSATHRSRKSPLKFQRRNTMFEFNIAEAFTNIILDAIKENQKGIKIGMKRIDFKEDIGLTEIKVTVNYNLVKFVSVGQTLNVFVGDNGDVKININKDDNASDIAVKIIAALN